MIKINLILIKITGIDNNILHFHNVTNYTREFPQNHVCMTNIMFGMGLVFPKSTYAQYSIQFYHDFKKLAIGASTLKLSFAVILEKTWITTAYPKMQKIPQ